MAESNPPTNTTPAPEPAVEKTDITGTTTTSSQTPPPPPPSEDKPSDAPVEPAAPPAAVPEPPKNDNVGDETKSVATTALTLISSGPVWPTLEENHPLAKFQARLPELLAAAEHAQIWGITLSAATPIPFHTTLILQKFLRANYNDVDKAYKQLLDTLKWRRKENPEGAVEEIFSEVKYDGLGYITKIKTKEGDEKVVTWNIYGACKDTRSTFGDLDG